MPAAFSKTTLPYELPQLLLLWLRAPAPGVGQDLEVDWVGRLLASIDENRPGLRIRRDAKKSPAGGRSVWGDRCPGGSIPGPRIREVVDVREDEYGCSTEQEDLQAAGVVGHPRSRTGRGAGGGELL